MDIRTEEDRVIEVLQIEGREESFEDGDFAPTRSSLYEPAADGAGNEVVPAYDENVAHLIVWKRPEEFCKNPVYFVGDGRHPYGVKGSLPDENFLGSLLAVAGYSKADLLQNVIASRPGDFVTYGIFTARFYVEGEWVEVIADTRIPTYPPEAGSGVYVPLYGRSRASSECWITLIEKAYAKALGTYEAITKVRIQDCLVHLTGGSVQMITMRRKHYVPGATAYTELWAKLKHYLHNDTLVIAMPAKEEDEANNTEDDDTALKSGLDTDAMEMNQGICEDRLYSVCAYREVGVIELVMLRDPWGLVTYEGEWSENSPKWDDYPDVLESITDDPSIEWSRDYPNGYIWMSFKEFVALFRDVYFCKLFPESRYSYYVAKGEWEGLSAGGPQNYVASSREEVMKLAKESEMKEKDGAASIVDSDSSWFNNPQYIIQAPKSTLVYISLTPLGEVSKLPSVSLDAVVVPSASRLNRIWDLSLCDPVALDEGECVPVKMKGQEATIWQMKIDYRYKYFIVPVCSRKGLSGNFVVRVFSLNPITMCEAPPAFSTVIPGEWKKYGDLDTTGGPLRVLVSDSDSKKKENPKWCQNSQYHLKVNNLDTLDDLYIKIVVRRRDKIVNANSGISGGQHRSSNAAAATGVLNSKGEVPNIGIVVVKATTNEDPTKKAIRKKTVKTNAFGEVMQTHESSLKKNRKSRPALEEEGRPAAVQSNADKIVIMRCLYVDKSVYHAATTYSSKGEASICYAKVPRIWMPNGLIVVPTLDEPGVRGQYDLEVYSSEGVTLTPLPDNITRTLAGEWTEGHSGGSQLNPLWKKNPRFAITFNSPIGYPTPFQIKLSRNGSTWKPLLKTDPVGCMIGFYVFVQEHGDLQPYYETPFLPWIEVCTEADFVLVPLGEHQSYVIMPVTYMENKHGSFILSVTSECDFSFGKEKLSHK